MVPSPGFLNPPSPYSTEARRDSIASSHFSKSSFASRMSEYSGPTTPICGQSPMAEEGFVDVMANEMRHDFQDQEMHGLPPSNPPKVLGSQQSLYTSWQMVPPAFSQSQATQLPPQLVLPTTGDFPQPHMIGHSGLDAELPTMDHSWVHFSSVVTPGMVPHWGNRTLDQAISEDNLLWDGHMQQPQHPMQTIVPSVAMVGDDNFYIQVGSESFTDSDSFVESMLSFVQSPQGVSFKRGSSPLPKQESDSEDGSPMTRAIYSSPTGSKSATKERRSCGSKQRSNGKKGEGERLPGVAIDAILQDVKICRDEKTGRWEGFSTRMRQPKHRCDFIDELTGVRCPQEFKRVEHQRWHKKTHEEIRPFACKICIKRFNSHDNLRRVSGSLACTKHSSVFLKLVGFWGVGIIFFFCCSINNLSFMYSSSCFGCGHVMYGVMRDEFPTQSRFGPS
ncbi:hypothetical protein K458DRAFT_487830 [Lentithecium fluviatile CBS 122367]|uniref:C2H2-type domain-containing protein n=1 Tax=Lentithecium fluviatile CBS 122367 TaxID=1168545 RepID=A0A6G1IZP0_9PLEO|nr:hypothetical protein K458DRAFT_487830 [Lentithecium fluviatile CBS 122367]